MDFERRKEDHQETVGQVSLHKWTSDLFFNAKNFHTEETNEADRTNEQQEDIQVAQVSVQFYFLVVREGSARADRLKKWDDQDNR
jgi:hypothetical protein